VSDEPTPDEPTTPRGHRQLDHTADLCLEVWAESEEELLLEGARAIAEVLMGERGAEVEGHATGGRRVDLEGIDAEDRAVQLWNEALVLAVLEGFLVTGGALTLDAERGVTGMLTGLEEASALVETELKCVTYHDLAYGVEDGRWRARMVIDV
jgi:SHS2 domain-containing protein